MCGKNARPHDEETPRPLVTWLLPPTARPACGNYVLLTCNPSTNYIRPSSRSKKFHCNPTWFGHEPCKCNCILLSTLEHYETTMVHQSFSIVFMVLVPFDTIWYHHSFVWESYICQAWITYILDGWVLVCDKKSYISTDRRRLASQLSNCDTAHISSRKSWPFLWANTTSEVNQLNVIKEKRPALSTGCWYLWRHNENRTGEEKRQEMWIRL